MYDQTRKPAYGGNNSYGGQQQQQQGGAQRPAGGSGGGGGGRATIPLRPVTIRMILDSQRVGEGAMTISNHEVGIVSVVGRILEVANAGGDLSGVGTAKNHTYRITDGTGILTVKHWLDTAAAIEPQAVGGFIVATGSVKIYQEKPVLSGTIRTVTDQNEVVYHLLDSINVHLRMIHGDRTPAGGKPKADASSPNRGVPPPATVPLAYGGGAYNAPVDNTANINATLYRVLVAANHNAVSAMDLLNGARSSGGGPGVTMQHVTAYLNEMTQNGTLNADGKGGYFL